MVMINPNGRTHKRKHAFTKAQYLIEGFKWHKYSNKRTMMVLYRSPDYQAVQVNKKDKHQHMLHTKYPALLGLVSKKKNFKVFLLSSYVSNL